MAGNTRETFLNHNVNSPSCPAEGDEMETAQERNPWAVAEPDGESRLS